MLFHHEHIRDMVMGCDHCEKIERITTSQLRIMHDERRVYFLRTEDGHWPLKTGHVAVAVEAVDSIIAELEIVKRSDRKDLLPLSWRVINFAGEIRFILDFLFGGYQDEPYFQVKQEGKYMWRWTLHPHGHTSASPPKLILYGTEPSLEMAMDKVEQIAKERYRLPDGEYVSELMERLK